MWPDYINGAFELIGSVMTWLNVRTLIRHKMFAGVHIQTAMFFTLWGAWNLFYYPHLGQIASFIGGVSIFVANFTWIILAIYYSRR